MPTKLIQSIILLLLLSCSKIVTSEQLPLDQPLPALLQGNHRSSDIHQILSSELLHQADFSSAASFASQWTVEGPAQLEFANNSLQFSSSLSDSFIQAYRDGEFDFIPNQLQQYHKVLGKLAKEQLPEAQYQAMLDKKGQFKGGHIVLWNKQSLPDSYLVEFDLQHQSPMGLFILFFSATGLDGSSIFASHHAKRNGVFKQYTSGDLQSYHISSYTPHRGSTNLRKNNKGGQLLKSQPDFASLAPDKIYKYRLIKWGKRFQLYLGDQLQIDYTDQHNHLKGGHVGLRLMASARARISDFKLYKLRQDPFALPVPNKEITVTDSQSLLKALAEVKPGTTVWLEDGRYPDVQTELNISGTLQQRIYIKARHPGKVLFTGKPAIKINASHISLSGIQFAEGQRFDNSQYVKNRGNKISKKAPYLVDMQGSYIRLSHCSIDLFDHHHNAWLNIEGHSNRVDHCSFVNKQTHGGVLSNAKPPKTGAYHRFDHNYFSRPDIGSDNAEVVRLATGWAHNINAYMTVEYNVFEQCNGEGEVISDKSSRNTIRLNRFINNQGGLSLRQGSHTHVYGNWFYRDQHNQKEGNKRQRDFGVMIRGKHHLIENNNFRGYGPNLVKLVNGQPLGYKKPGRPAQLPRHHIAAEDVLLRHNDFWATAFLAEIDKRKYNKDRSVLAHNIHFKQNLITGIPGWRLLTTMPYAAVTWHDNAFVGKSKVEIPGNSNYPDLSALPKAYQQRFGSQTLTPYFINHSVGPAWQPAQLQTNTL